MQRSQPSYCKKLAQSFEEINGHTHCFAGAPRGIGIKGGFSIGAQGLSHTTLSRSLEFALRGSVRILQILGVHPDVACKMRGIMTARIINTPNAKIAKIGSKTAKAAFPVDMR